MQTDTTRHKHGETEEGGGNVKEGDTEPKDVLAPMRIIRWEKTPKTFSGAKVSSRFRPWLSRRLNQHRRVSGADAAVSFRSSD